MELPLADSRASRIARASEIAARQVAGEVLVFPLARTAAQVSCIYTFEGVGGFVWEQLSTPQTMDELVESVVETFDVSPEVAARDVGAFIGELRQTNLVRMTEDVGR